MVSWQTMTEGNYLRNGYFVTYPWSFAQEYLGTRSSWETKCKGNLPEERERNAKCPIVDTVLKGYELVEVSRIFIVSLLSYRRGRISWVLRLYRHVELARVSYACDWWSLERYRSLISIVRGLENMVPLAMMQLSWYPFISLNKRKTLVYRRIWNFNKRNRRIIRWHSVVLFYYHRSSLIFPQFRFFI